MAVLMRPLRAAGWAAHPLAPPAWVTALLAAALMLALPAQAGQVVDAAGAKAAFVYNFIKLVDWPAETFTHADHVELCLVGPGQAFVAAVAELARKPAVHGRPLEVRQLQHPADSSGCQVMVLSGFERVPLEWLQPVRSQPVLTIGDSEGFAAAGGSIGLYVEAEHLRFEINTEAVRRSSLRPSSQLLKLARLVGDGGAGVRP